MENRKPKYGLFDRVLIVNAGDESLGVNQTMRDMVGQEATITGSFWSKACNTYMYEVNRRSFYWEEGCFEPAEG